MIRPLLFWMSCSAVCASLFFGRLSGQEPMHPQQAEHTQNKDNKRLFPLLIAVGCVGGAALLLLMIAKTYGRYTGTEGDAPKDIDEFMKVCATRFGSATQLNQKSRANGSTFDLGKLGRWTVEKCGEGATGTVWSLSQRGTVVAMKWIEGKQVSNTEIDYHRQFSGGPFPKFHGVERLANGDVLLFMERLRPLIEDRVGISLTRAGVMSLADGLLKMHEAGVIHGDIKYQNVMVRPGTEAWVLIDFGRSRPAKLGEIDNRGATFEVSPPEFEDHFPPTEEGVKTVTGHDPKKEDVYQLGCLLFTLRYGQMIGATEDDLNALLRNQETKKLVMEMIRGGVSSPTAAAYIMQTLLDRDGNGLTGLVCRMLSKDPADRPTMNEVVKELASVDQFTLELNRA